MGLEADQQAEGPAPPPGGRAAAPCSSPPRPGPSAARARASGSVVVLEHGEGDRALDLGRQPPIHSTSRVGVHEVLGRRRRPGPARRRRARRRAAPTRAEQLVLGGEGAGDRLAVHGAMPERAAGGERRARRPRRRRARSRASPRCPRAWRARSWRRARPSRRRAPAPWATWVPKSTAKARLSSTSRYSREGLPAPGHALGQRRAGDVLDAFHQLDQPSSWPGPNGREADAAVAHDERRDAMAGRRVERVVPGDLAVVVGVDVDEAGGDQLPSASMVSVASPSIVSVTSTIRPSFTATSTVRAGSPVPSTTVP